MLLQKQTPSTRTLTTAHLAQTMALLPLNTAELRQKIETELASNPALELVEERRCPNCHRLLTPGGLCPACTNRARINGDQPIVFLSSREEFFAGSKAIPADEDLAEEFQAPASEGLAEYVLRQIGPELAEQDRPIAVHILTSLNDDGLLDVPIIEIARYHHVPLQRIEGVICAIQRADPPGVGSISPQTALLSQLEMFDEPGAVPQGTAQAIQAGLDYLAPKRAPELAHQMRISVQQARKIIQFISDNLNPFPARAHWGEGSRTVHISGAARQIFDRPDTIISCLTESEDTPLLVEVGMPFVGTLRINPLFRDALQNAPEDKAGLWQQDLERASLLVKCLQQRNNTIVRLMKQLAIEQRDFILYGDAYLRPLTRARMAKVLNVHESTISRAVAGKAIQLPSRRIVPLAMFFDRSLHVRTVLKEIIHDEGSPLSDAEIADLLLEKGFPVARRTVAKYRMMEGILPVHLRDQSHAPTIAFSSR